MKKIIIILLLAFIPLFAFTGFHKYYISITQINYIKEKQSVQIITRIFIDDFEKVLRERYDDKLELLVKNESKDVNEYIEQYLKNKMRVTINEKNMTLNFIGKEYDIDVVQCYLEIENVKNINSIEISNQILFDLFDNQQNMIKTKINSKQKSFLLNQSNKIAMLNFN